MGRHIGILLAALAALLLAGGGIWLAERPGAPAASPRETGRTLASRVEGIQYTASRDDRIEVAVGAAAVETRPRRVGPIRLSLLRELVVEDLRLHFAVDRDPPAARPRERPRPVAPVAAAAEAVDEMRDVLNLGGVTRIRARPLELRFVGPQGPRFVLFAGEGATRPGGERLELGRGVRVETAADRRLEARSATWWRRTGRLDLRGPWTLHDGPTHVRGTDAMFATDVERGRIWRVDRSPRGPARRSSRPPPDS